MSDIAYTLCDNPVTCAHAVQVLQQAPFIVIDCEGHNLGRAGGCVTLICVGTPTAEQIYLFDLLSPYLFRVDVEPLYDLLRSPYTVKVVWDGRMDCLELWNSCGVYLDGVLDLQLAEVVSRMTIRGEGERERLRRLTTGFLSRVAVGTCVQDLDDLHAVIGLQRCWTESGFDKTIGKDPEVVQMHKDKKGSLWMSRPLTPQLLQYAAKDILLIAILYAEFGRKGWISFHPVHYNHLLAVSRRYVSAHIEQGKSHEMDVFRPTGIVPLDVLTEPWGARHLCMACNRNISLSCFDTVFAGRQRWRRPRCRLCAVLACKYHVALDDRWFLT